MEKAKVCADVTCLQIARESNWNGLQKSLFHPAPQERCPPKRHASDWSFKANAKIKNFSRMKIANNEDVT